MENVHRHFSRIASKYSDLRTTDPEPVLFIKDKLSYLDTVVASDIGCGCGRYALQLFDQLGDTLHLTCVDPNKNMLNELAKDLRRRHLTEFRVVRGSSRVLPLADNCQDAVFTFNAIHHFNVPLFLEEASRVLRENRHVFIYTRLRHQNRGSIWGRFFPSFHEKETRLYELDELIRFFEMDPCLELESTKKFKYMREATLDQLTEQARQHHYSTFALYEEEEFNAALGEFRRKIMQHFDGPSHITWNDGNVMFHLRKGSQ
jgi:ubiquinone/menaquinone biosynthesis C-methylase UbiE